jgi:UDP-glucose 4-epimerase
MILVTGGAGYIGSHTVVELLNTGYEVIIVDDFSNSKPEVIDKIKIITQKSPILEIVDIKDQEKLNYVFQNNNIEGVIHFAALKAVSESIEKSLDYYQNNISGLINVLQCCKKHNVNKFIFSSSCTVYGNPDEIMVDEQAPTKESTTPYGKSKKMGEDIIIDSTLSNNFKSVLLRYFNPVGSHDSGLIGDDPSGVPNNLVPYLTKVVNGDLEQLSVFGDDYNTPDGTCIRDYIHVVDLAISHVKSLEYLDKLNNNEYDIFNLGTGSGSSVLDLINSFEESTNKKVNYKIVGRRDGDIESIYCNPKKANDILEWKTKYDLLDMMKSAWNYQLNN